MRSNPRRGSLRTLRIVVVTMAVVVAACGAGNEGAGVTRDDRPGQGTEAGATTRPGDVQTTTTGPSACTLLDEADPTTSTSSTPTSTPPTSSASTTASLTTTTTTTTTTSTTTTTDPELAARQAALTELGYWLGEVDGLMGPSTAHAVTAFQKAEGLDRTGTFDESTVARLATATRPQATTSGHALEVDLARQILLVADDGRVEWVFDIATGAPATPTPPGEFTIYREIDGLRHAPLGTLYRPKYFNGGIAFHGYPSVPPQPASHGCVRLTYPAMDFVWDAGLAPIGTRVVVY